MDRRRKTHHEDLAKAECARPIARTSVCELPGDGSRFLVARRPQASSAGDPTNAITVVMNWQPALKH